MNIAPASMNRSAALPDSAPRPGSLMTWQKRLFDLSVVLAIAPFAVPLAVFTALAILFVEGGPVLYRAHRVGEGGRRFFALKFRTMRQADGLDGGVSGGDKTHRISRFSAVLRKLRLDEVPQLINVFKGEMSLVGPRPPDPRYVEMFPEIYNAVLRSRPGLTGLATLLMHRYEDRVLNACRTAQETEDTYCRLCITRKARLDLKYQTFQRRGSCIWLDVVLILRSVQSVLR